MGKVQEEKDSGGGRCPILKSLWKKMIGLYRINGGPKNLAHLQGRKKRLIGTIYMREKKTGENNKGPLPPMTGELLKGEKKEDRKKGENGLDNYSRRSSESGKGTGRNSVSEKERA